MHIAKFLLNGFQKEGIQVTHAPTGVDGLHEATEESYDLIVLDLMLPLKSGYDVLESLRGEGYSTPVIILSAKHSVKEKVIGLQSGADDYLVKPFAFPELFARCQALYRRGNQNNNSVDQLQYNELTLDLMKHSLKRGDNDIPLNQREFALMRLFMESPERVFSKTIHSQMKKK